MGHRSYGRLGCLGRATPRAAQEADDRLCLLKPSGWQVDTEGDEDRYIEEAHAQRRLGPEEGLNEAVYEGDKACETS